MPSPAYKSVFQGLLARHPRPNAFVVLAAAGMLAWLALVGYASAQQRLKPDRVAFLSVATAKRWIHKEPDVAIRSCWRVSPTNVRCAVVTYAWGEREVTDNATGEVVSIAPVRVGFPMTADVGLKGVQWVFRGEAGLPY